MRIVIDMQGAQTNSRFRGIGRYTMNLAKAMARNAGKHEIWLVLNGQLQESVSVIREAFKGLIPESRIKCFYVPVPVHEDNPHNIWRNRAAEYMREHFLSELKPDILLISSLIEGYSDCATTSVKTFDKQVLTASILYDLIPLLNLDVYAAEGPPRNWYFRKIEALQKVDLLLSISEHSRQEAIDNLAFEESRIVNISTAADSLFKPLNEDSDSKRALLERFGIKEPYLLYIGGFEYRKNIEKLLAAYGLLKPELREKYQFVLAGSIDQKMRDWLYLNADTARLRREDYIFTGLVNDHELLYLYNYCKLFVFPSLHEGFGLPVLEAMSCGAPVIGSSLTSIPEVINNEAALFDPHNLESMAGKIEQALTDEHFLAALREHSASQSVHFSWDKTALKALAALEEFHDDMISSNRHFLNTIYSKKVKDRFLYSLLAEIREGEPTGNDLLQTATCQAKNNVETVLDNPILSSDDQLAWRIEGPFDSSYSLALINREYARALSKLGHKVALHSTEGPGDFPPSPEYLEKYLDLAFFHDTSCALTPENADVVSRNLFPPRVEDMTGKMNLLHSYAWEESGFPEQWAKSFSFHLDGITCLSSHVQKVLTDNGVNLPLSIAGCGVDHWEKIESSKTIPVEARAFRFLHVSSCFPRKGADVLLKAYGQAFSSSDDVSLIIKTFNNPHNKIHQWLEESRAENKNYPDVVIIEEDISEEDLKALYEYCHVLVAPSRAEGFGLPLAEAMLSGLPVITTAWSGQLDFCSTENAWLVDYSFEPARTHFELFGSVWANPDLDDLVLKLKQAYRAGTKTRKAMAQLGKSILKKEHNWTDVATRSMESVRKWRTGHLKQSPRIGWITTWNTRCGIATYSEHYLKYFPGNVEIFAAQTADMIGSDGSNVHRCWDLGGDEPLAELRETVRKNPVDVLVIQWNYFFFYNKPLAEFIAEQKKFGTVVVAILHSTVDPEHPIVVSVLDNIEEKKLAATSFAFHLCDRVLVHGIPDLNRLKNIGVVNNASLFPHPILDFNPEAEQKEKGLKNVFTLASFGFFLPDKGLLELIEAVSILNNRGLSVNLNLVNAEYPASESRKLISRAKKLITRLKMEKNINLYTGFYEDEDCLRRLSKADLIVFPYKKVRESASGAVRYGIASGRPVAVTPSPIFSDLEGVVFELPGFSTKEIADGLELIIQQIQNQSPEAEKKEAMAARWREAHRYAVLGDRLYRMLCSLFQQEVEKKEGNYKPLRNCFSGKKYFKVLATDTYIKNQVGNKRKNSVDTSGVAGYLVYGYYLRLNKGNYRVVANFDKLKKLTGTGKIDVTCSVGKAVLAEKEFQFAEIQESGRVSLDFKTTRFEHYVEIRIYCHEGASASFIAFEVKEK